MSNKEQVRNRFAVLEGNPTREERILALYEGKVIKGVTYTTTYYKLDKYKRICFSSTNHPSSFHPYHDGYNYKYVLDDYDDPSNCKRRIYILD